MQFGLGACAKVGILARRSEHCNAVPTRFLHWHEGGCRVLAEC